MRRRLKSIVSSKSDKIAFASVALIGALSLVLGLWIGARDFTIGLLASLVALAVTIFSASFYFDARAEDLAEQRRQAKEELDEQQRQAKWEVVRVATLTAIWDQVRRMMLPVVVLSPESNWLAAAYEAEIEKMEAVLAWTSTQMVRHNKKTGDTVETYEECKADMVRLFNEVAREHVYLRDVLTPRVVEFSGDQNLVELLFALDDMERQWSSIVFLAGPGEVQRNWEAFRESAWNGVRDFLKAALDVSRRIAAERDLPTPRGIQACFVDIGDRTVVRSRTIYE